MGEVAAAAWDPQGLPEWLLPPWTCPGTPAHLASHICAELKPEAQNGRGYSSW